MKSLWASLAWVMALTLVSCSQVDETPYPDLITEMVVAVGNAEGLVATITTDSGKHYDITNEMKGLEPCERLRGMASYVVNADTRTNATLYSLQAALMLQDCADSTRLQHPTGVQSVWQGGGYINLHLYPKSEGHRGYWGFLRDSVRVNSLGRTTHHLSLYHNQGDDATAFSSHLYASLHTDSIHGQPGDSVILAVHTFQGIKEWGFYLP